jgi:hypothetical protein
MPVRRTSGPRTLDAALHLLDRQLVDRDERLVGNVDDLELEVPDDGGLPVIVAIVSGPGALADRIGGRLGRSWAELHRRISPGGPAVDPDLVPFSAVTKVASAVHLDAQAEDLEANASERWVRDHIIAKIPGADHAPG